MTIPAAVLETDNVTDFVAALGESATLSIPGVDPQAEIDDLIDLVERVFVQIYASGLKKMLAELIPHLAAVEAVKIAANEKFDWLPTVEDWAFEKLDTTKKH